MLNCKDLGHEGNKTVKVRLRPHHPRYACNPHHPSVIGLRKTDFSKHSWLHFGLKNSLVILL